jgi:hypothetical protein
MKVFISYSHDSVEHTRRVRALAEQLRKDGVDASIDQYTQDPNEGWIGDIVKCCVSERGASLLNDWLGGLLGLFFAIDELNADDDLGDEFKALESTPMLLGFEGEFKDHRQGRDP